MTGLVTQRDFGHDVDGAGEMRSKRKSNGRHKPDCDYLWHLACYVGAGPANGEIDIIEFPNLVCDNLMALHTSEDCTIAGTGESGTLLTNDCGAGGGFAGCYTSPKKANSAGTNFNEGGGGVYAMEWTSVAIRIWFFPRGHIPPTVLSSHPDPSKFGVPDANFEGGCDIDKYFRNGTLIFNIEFCGTWAGPTFVSDGCPALNITSQWSSCNMFVAANPDAYKDSYFAVNYVHVYTTTPGSPPPPSSVLSSILPVAKPGTTDDCFGFNLEYNNVYEHNDYDSTAAATAFQSVKSTNFSTIADKLDSAYRSIGPGF
ncbi:glycoside hydrolase family 16 protein [Zasmidium cellare ATCC 36951]|uniref:Glycoside hydrolase family 16 protein n=1 Tax=Zasmidium cellare ATCC 36951 TaxID=1080233 RepID=A0A6A6CZR8_ZASCE|nr:glycoside hydrolase family 16 protein [Zasmidium cellare ATCC 36951]KAF2171309.1 glycoside hydrolase family 16 protein [Zasmidium cellare ATCC 36951]